jgi:hypothetical protein
MGCEVGKAVGNEICYERRKECLLLSFRVIILKMARLYMTGLMLTLGWLKPKRGIRKEFSIYSRTEENLDLVSSLKFIYLCNILKRIPCCTENTIFIHS